MLNLFRCARHEVPPHQDRLWKWKSANQQYATSILAFELDTRTTRPEIPETCRVNPLAIDLYIAGQ
jgi:hypothetical protein